jgi:hypothetical protein
VSSSCQTGGDEVFSASAIQVDSLNRVVPQICPIYLAVAEGFPLSRATGDYRHHCQSGERMLDSTFHQYSPFTRGLLLVFFPMVQRHYRMSQSVLYNSSSAIVSPKTFATFRLIASAIVGFTCTGSRQGLFL